MATNINYCPPSPNEATLRRYRVPDLWGKISLDWNSNPALARKPKHGSSQVSEDSKILMTPCSVRIERCKSSSSSLVWDVEKVKLWWLIIDWVYYVQRQPHAQCTTVNFGSFWLRPGVS